MQSRYERIYNRMKKLINRAERIDKPKMLKRKCERLWKWIRGNSLFAVSILSLLFTLPSCDGHKDFPDTAMKIGHVVCTDGQVMSYEECEAFNKEPIAVVFYINNNIEVEGHGFAVYFKDTPNKAFTDSIGIAQGTSADILAYDGNLNTYRMFANTACSSPIAESVYDMWKYGQSAYIPSVAQMRLLFQAKETINPIIEKCGGIPIPDEPAKCWYWTSTEVQDQQTAKAWLYSLASGTMQETPKLQEHKVRPIITIND